MSYVIHFLKLISFILLTGIVARCSMQDVAHFNQPASQLLSDMQFLNTSAHRIVIASPSEPGHDYAQQLKSLAWRAEHVGRHIEFDTTLLSSQDAEIMRDVAKTVHANVR